MNLIQLNNLIKQIAQKTPLVENFSEGDVYDNWNSKELKYGSVNLTLQNAQKNGSELIYNGIIYYGDRLLEDHSNINSIYTDAFNVIHGILGRLNEENGIHNIDSYQVEFFEQKFADELAGGYANIAINVYDDTGDCGFGVNIDIPLPDVPLKNKNIYVNGKYTAKDEGLVGYSEVNVETESLDFKGIGYPMPQYLKDGIDYAKTITEHTSHNHDEKLIFYPNINAPVKNAKNMFNACIYLQWVDKIDLSEVDDCYSFCAECKTLRHISELDLKNCKSMSRAFLNTTNLLNINIKNIENITDFSWSFYGSSIEQFNYDLNTVNCEDFTVAFYGMYNLKKIKSIDIQNIKVRWNQVFNNSNNLSYLKIKNLGKSESITVYDFKYNRNWGNDSMTFSDGTPVKGSLESLLETFTYNGKDGLFDRKTAGYPVATIEMHKEIKQRLSEEKIKYINNLGYTVV